MSTAGYLKHEAGWTRVYRNKCGRKSTNISFVTVHYFNDGVNVVHSLEFQH